MIAKCAAAQSVALGDCLDLRCGMLNAKDERTVAVSFVPGVQ
jgi:hypothetical protein